MNAAGKKVLVITRNFQTHAKQLTPTFLLRLLDKVQDRDIIVISCDDTQYTEEYDFPVKRVPGFFRERSEAEISRLYMDVWEGRIRVSRSKALFQRHYSLLRATIEIIPLLPKVRIIHWFEIFSPIASFLRFLSRFYGIKNYITLASLTPNLRFYNPLLRASLCYFDQVVATTLALKRFLEGVGFPSAKIQQIPLGVDLAAFKPRPEDRATLKLSEGIDPERKVVTWFGPINPIKFKDFLQLLNFAHLIDQSIPCFFVFAFKYGLPLSIDRSLIGGNMKFVTPRSINKLLAISDLAVLPFSDGNTILSPLTVIEALSSGVPVVTTNLPGLDEIVSNRVSGILVNRINEIPQVVLELLTQENRLATMSQYARRVAEEKFDVNETAKSYTNLWKTGES